MHCGKLPDWNSASDSESRDTTTSGMIISQFPEIVGEYVHKGQKLYVEGKLQTSTWEDKQSGEKKYRTEIVARDIVLLGSRDNGQEGTGKMPNGQSSPEPAPAVADDDIPF